MKTSNFITKIAVLLLISFFYSCEESTPEPISKESILYLSIMSEPKTKVEENLLNTDQGIDNKINHLDIFIFHNNPSSKNHHILDAYKSIEVKDIGTLDEIEIQSTTGDKTIIVVANSHRENWVGITSFSEFTSEQALLSNEEAGEFTMSGSQNATLRGINNLSFSLARLVGRIQINSIKTFFAGTPYQGAVLSDVEIYMTNVHGNKQHLGHASGNTIILNQGKLVEEDGSKCAMPGIINDQIITSIDDSGYNTKHYFYAYENTLEQENDTQKYTRVVLQAKLNGILYYYPININQEGFGHISNNGHKGIKRNTSYSMDITILRPGSLDPNKPVEHGTLKMQINISNWAFVPHSNIEF